MTISELRNTKDYIEAVEKIKRWEKGKSYTIRMDSISQAKKNALLVILDDCEREGLIESVSIGLSLEGKVVEERFRKN